MDNSTNYNKQFTHIEGRVSSLEASMVALAQSVERQGVDQASRFDRLEQSISSIGVNTKTQWGPIVSAFGAFTAVLLALIGMFGAGIASDVTRIEKGYIRESDKLDINIHRELSELNALSENRRATLDEKLTSEFNNKDSLLGTELKWIKDSLDDTREWREHHDQISGHVEARHSESIRALEREVFGKENKRQKTQNN